MAMKDNSGRSLFWGEMHDNTHQAEDPDFSMDERLEVAFRHLDFYCGAYYPSTSPAFRKGGHPSDDKGRQPLNVEAWKDDDQIGAEWSSIKEAIQCFHAEGFVVFPGYEWQGDGSWGDHNVFYNEDDPPLYKVETLDELYDRLRKHQALAIPHHTAYINGFRGKDWSCLDSELSPFAEIYSIHGSSEGDRFGEGLRTNPFLGPDMSEGSYSAALTEGLHLGAVGSTDNWGPLPGHYGRGLAAVWADKLTRDSLWEAFRSRRVYAVSGDRIGLQFDAGDFPMGSIVSSTEGDHVFHVQAEGLDGIDYIDFMRDEVLVDRFSPMGGGNCGEGEYLFRIEFGWGPAANVLSLPPRSWEGIIDVEGGTLKSATPCWVSEDHEYFLSDDSFRWTGRTGQETVSSRTQNAYVLKVSGNPETRIRYRINNKAGSMTIGEMCRESRIVWDRRESVEFIRKNFSIDPEALDRKDVIFGMAYKCKISRAVSEKEYKVDCHFKDETPGNHVYRVRVIQKNGHKAWSSPIWFEE